MIGQPGFFDLSDRYAALSAAGDPLERLTAVVDFEVFRGPLIVALRRSDLGKGGRPPFDPVMMFKILVLQALYSLSDEATEFQIKDRLSFQRFLGLGLDGRVQYHLKTFLLVENICCEWFVADRSGIPDRPLGIETKHHARREHRQQNDLLKT